MPVAARRSNDADESPRKASGSKWSLPVPAPGTRVTSVRSFDRITARRTSAAIIRTAAAASRLRRAAERRRPALPTPAVPNARVPGFERPEDTANTLTDSGAAVVWPSAAATRSRSRHPARDGDHHNLVRVESPKDRWEEVVKLLKREGLKTSPRQLDKLTLDFEFDARGQDLASGKRGPEDFPLAWRP